MNNQDQRPVYMGTFSKYTRTFEHKLACVENDTADLEKKIRIYVNKLNTYQTTTNRIFMILTATNLTMLAIYLLNILK